MPIISEITAETDPNSFINPQEIAEQLRAATTYYEERMRPAITTIVDQTNEDGVFGDKCVYLDGQAPFLEKAIEIVDDIEDVVPRINNKFETIINDANEHLKGETEKLKEILNKEIEDLGNEVKSLESQIWTAGNNEEWDKRNSLIYKKNQKEAKIKTYEAKLKVNEAIAKRKATDIPKIELGV